MAKRLFITVLLPQDIVGYSPFWDYLIEWPVGFAWQNNLAISRHLAEQSPAAGISPGYLGDRTAFLTRPQEEHCTAIDLYTQRNSQ
jgi:hypothetical protein